MTDDLAQIIAELRAKAEAARGTTLPLQVPAIRTPEQEASLNFLKVATPSRVLALLAVVEAAQARVEEGHGIDCAAIQTEEREPCDCGHDHLAAALSNLARNL